MRTSTAFGVDIGGSGIKGAIVDLETGVLAAERVKYLTPNPSTPGARRRGRGPAGQGGRVDR